MDISILSANDALVHTGDKATAVKLTIIADEKLQKQVAGDTIVVLVIDTSTSMNEASHNPREAKLDEAKREGERFINQLPEGVRLAVISGSDSAKLVLNPTLSRDDARKAIRQLSANGGTSIDTWIDKASSVVRSLTTECLVQLVVLTDGQHYAPRNRELDVAIANAKGLFDCYAIGFGDGMDYSTLEKLAKLNGKMFSAIDGDLTNIFSEINASASSKVAKFQLALNHEEWIKVASVEELFPDIITRSSSTGKVQGADMPLETKIDLGQFAAGETKEYLIKSEYHRSGRWFAGFCSLKGSG